jgi:hypothetical protein
VCGTAVRSCRVVLFGLEPGGTVYESVTDTGELAVCGNIKS